MNILSNLVICGYSVIGGMGVHTSVDTLTEGAWGICVHPQMNHGYP